MKHIRNSGLFFVFILYLVYATTVVFGFIIYCIGHLISYIIDIIKNIKNNKKVRDNYV